MSKYYVYMLRCSGESLYTGFASDLSRRIREHFERSPRCAKYTRSHPPQKLEAAWECDSKSAALQLEYRIKQLPRSRKLLLIRENDMSFCMQPELYRRIPTEEYEAAARRTKEKK